MFYLIIGTLLILYYIFLAPKTIKSTMNIVLLVGLVALVSVLMVLGLIRMLQAPIEIFIGIAMTVFGAYVLRDVWRLEKVEKKETSKKA